MKAWLLGLGAFAGGACVLVSMAILVDGSEIPSATMLTVTYFVFFVSLVCFVHCIGFGFSLWTGIALDLRITKFLDYASIGLVALGLIEIVGFGPKYYAYLLATGPDQPALLREASSLAASQLKNECVDGERHTFDFGVQTFFHYSPEYCAKLKRLVAQRLDAALAIAGDSAFMNHVVMEVITPRPPRPGPGVQDQNPIESDIKNPIADLVQRMATLSRFKTYVEDENLDSILKWLSMLLLPFAIALTALKTSLELFGLPRAENRKL